MLPKKELYDNFLEKFSVFDEQITRARTFVLDILFKCAEIEIVPMKKTFEDMAYLAEDRRRRRTMETDRFEMEQPFIEVIRELIQLQQELAQRIKTTKSMEVV